MLISIIYTYDDVKRTLGSYGLLLETKKEEYKGVSISKLVVSDSEGFRYTVTYDKILRNNNGDMSKGRLHKSNPFSVENINNYLKIWDVPFVCISDGYINEASDLTFKCLRCNEIVCKPWKNVHKKDDRINRRHIVCQNCDRRYESLHASVLKQIFMHEFPDTIVEDCSFRSRKTGKIRPTDIVNHRLKIAIEVQSQWHDFAEAKIKDVEKKKFWEDSGYRFYNPDIRDYSVLEMCNLFFDLDKLPEYVSQNYGKCINAKVVQDLLNNGYDITTICNITGYTRHQIHDAKLSGKISYPQYYKNSCRCPVEQYSLDWEYIATYQSIADAGRAVGTSPKNIVSQLEHNRTYCAGYNWKRKQNVL